MTKKELLRNDVFRALPDDAEIMFGTDESVLRCVPLNALNLSIVKQWVNEHELYRIPLEERCNFKPEYKVALLIDAIPFWYLKEKYNITFGDGQEKE